MHHFGRALNVCCDEFRMNIPSDQKTAVFILAVESVAFLTTN